MSVKHVLITGAAGSLGRRMVQAFREIDIKVTPTGRPGHHDFPWTLYALDAANRHAVLDTVVAVKPDLVIAAAAYTNVSRAEFTPSLAWKGNVDTAEATAWACEQAGIECYYLSSDYVLPVKWNGLWWTIEGGTAYGESKRVGERVARNHSARVVRVAHLDPDKAKDYTWVNGYSVAHRMWTEQCAFKLARFVLEEPRFGIGGIMNIGTESPCTVAEMVRARWPDHPALNHVVTDPEEHRQLAGFAAPKDTRWVVRSSRR